MKYIIVDGEGVERTIEADRVEVTTRGEEPARERVAFWKGEVIVAMFWDLKGFFEIEQTEEKDG